MTTTTTIARDAYLHAHDLLLVPDHHGIVGRQCSLPNRDGIWTVESAVEHLYIYPLNRTHYLVRHTSGAYRVAARAALRLLATEESR